MELIDTHCHLMMGDLAEQVEAVLERARQAKVTSWITIGTTLEDGQANIELAKEFDNLYCTVGIHPHEAGIQEAGWLQALKSQALNEKVVSLGEMGLDYYYDHSPRDVQQKVFAEQLELAKELKLPAVIHCRDAMEDCLGILKDFTRDDLPVVFHCYAGNLTETRTVLDRGYLVSFTGVITFKNAEKTREVARYVPLDRIMLETDAPFMSPVPKRNVKPNEPALMIHTAQKLAEIKETTLEHIAGLTTENAQTFFRLK